MTVSPRIPVTHRRVPHSQDAMFTFTVGNKDGETKAFVVDGSKVLADAEEPADNAALRAKFIAYAYENLDKGIDIAKLVKRGFHFLAWCVKLY